MDVLIDPKVFDVACKNDACTQTLAKFQQKKDSYQFITTRTLKQCYVDFIGRPHVPKNNGEQLARAVARCLISGTGFKYLRLDLDTSTPLPPHIQGQVTECNIDKIEHHLLEIVVDRCVPKLATEVGPAIVLLLACSAELPSTCLRQQSVRDALCGTINGLIMQCVEDYSAVDKIEKHRVDLAKLANRVKEQHNARFEDQCALWLGRYLRRGCETRVKRWDCEVDILAEDSVVEPPHIALGECKLIHGHSDGRDEQYKAITQLDNWIGAHSKGSSSEVHWECFVFCNAKDDYDDDVLQRARQVALQTGATISFVRVRMPGGWHKQTGWSLRDGYFSIEAVCYHPELLTCQRQQTFG